MNNDSEPGSVEGAEVREEIFARYSIWLDRGPAGLTTHQHKYFLKQLWCYTVVLSGQLVTNTLFDQEEKGKVEEEEKLLVPASPPSPRLVIA